MAEWHGLLVCPHCGHDLVESDGTLTCDTGHSFDIARQGYVSLLPGGTRAHTADTPDMVSARADFLAHGHFAPLDVALADAVEAAVAGLAGCIVDAGAGTGEHLAAVLERLPGRTGLALDVSKHAAKRAARAHPRIGAVVCDVWGPLPIRSDAAACVLSVFAPRNAVEFARVLEPGGALVVVTPTPAHLAELVAPLGLVSVDPRKDERLAGALAGHFALEGEIDVAREIVLSREDAIAIALMGPSAHHVDPAEVRSRLTQVAEPVRATLSVVASTWRVTKE